MVRMARAVAAGVPHHITQRGNRRQRTFFYDTDYAEYLRLLGEWTAKSGVAVWAYCLMPNHLHLIAVPDSETSLRAALAETHRRYTRMINFRESWRGCLWQGRFASFVMDEIYLMACARYIEQNPVRARLVERPEDWPWSSARAHLAGADDGVVRVAPLLERALRPWSEFLTIPIFKSDAALLRRHERTGRPLGDKSFVYDLEQTLGRPLAPRPGGRPKKEKEA